ncbi:MAG TPA: CDP-alcohol phosphatidyltransferase family protein [Solirubrobacterales bacterium]|nr:CDP-alcohol phosphatidyltransferase family protein [Solirubrobacterales bacterium]
MGDQSFVSSATRARIRGAVTPIALGAGKLGLTPNALTVIGFGISAVAAATAAAQLWLPAAILVIFGGSFDMLDGGLARAQNRVTRFGAFLDSTLDRWGEGVVYIGIVAGASAAGFVAGAVLAAAAAVSSFQVSYTRAKAESLGLHGEVGIAPRAERLVLLTAGLVAAGLDGGVAPGARGQLWLSAALGIIFVTASITAIQRTWHVRAQLRSKEQGEK